MLSYGVEGGRINETKRKIENELARLHNEIRWLKLGFGVLRVVIVMVVVWSNSLLKNKLKLNQYEIIIIGIN